jgi:choline dehydrogenase
MLAERTSDIIRDRPLLAASNASVGVAAGVGITQRSGEPLRKI